MALDDVALDDVALDDDGELLMPFPGAPSVLKARKASQASPLLFCWLKTCQSTGGHCSKTVVVLCSEPSRSDQNGANQVADKWLKNQLE
jgi:hypothetical protein